MPFYFRYIDEKGTAVPDTTAAKMLTHINEKHQTFKFEMEIPDADFLLLWCTML